MAFRLARRVAPAEWVLIAFTCYAAARMLGSGTVAFTAAAFPRQDVAITLLAILTARLGAEFRSEPWIDAAAQRRHWIALPLFFAPAIVIVAARRHLAEFDVEAARLASMIDRGRNYADALAFASVPPLFFWLFSGLHDKRRALGEAGSVFVALARYALRAGRAWFAPMLLVYAYVLMAPVLERPLVGDQDARLAAIDRALFFGHNPNLLCDAIARPWLSEWLAGAYVFYAPLFPLALGVAYVKDPARFRELAFATTFALAAGYACYTIVPAQGPLFTMRFEHDLDLYYLREVKLALMDRLRVARDCFPSLHTCVSLVLFRGIARSSPKLAWALAPLVLSIPIACVYLRYHYVVDVLAGVALFGLTTWLTSRIFRLRGETAPAAGPP